MTLNEAPVDVLPLANAKHEDNEPLFFDGVNDPILADAKPVEAFCRARLAVFPGRGPVHTRSGAMC